MTLIASDTGYIKCKGILNVADYSVKIEPSIGCKMIHSINLFW